MGQTIFFFTRPLHKSSSFKFVRWYYHCSPCDHFHRFQHNSIKESEILLVFLIFFFLMNWNSTHADRSFIDSITIVFQWQNNDKQMNDNGPLDLFYQSNTQILITFVSKKMLMRSFLDIIRKRHFLISNACGLPLALFPAFGRHCYAWFVYKVFSLVSFELYVCLSLSVCLCVYHINVLWWAREYMIFRKVFFPLLVFVVFFFFLVSFLFWT